MKKKLDPSIILLPGIKFNSELEYVEGDDIWNFDDTEVENEKYAQNESYFQNEKFQYITYNNHPQISYLPFEFKKGNVGRFCSNAQIIRLSLNKKTIKQFKNLHLTNSVDSDGVHYIANTDTFVIDKKSYKELRKGNTLFNVTLYNMDSYKGDYELLKNKFEVIVTPSFNLQHIPGRGVISIIREKKFLEVDGLKMVYLNLPSELYDSIVPINTAAVYNNTEKEWTFEFKNSTAFNFYTYDIAKNGFKKPVAMRLNKDFTLSCIASYNKVVIAHYLGLSSFPVCIYVNLSQDRYEGEDLPTQGNKEGLRRLLEPYLKMYEDL